MARPHLDSANIYHVQALSIAKYNYKLLFYCCNYIYSEGILLTQLLKTYHISRSSLAYELNLTLQTIHNWCSGRVLIPNSKLGGLCEVLEKFGIPSDELAALTLSTLQSHGLQPERFARKNNPKAPTIMLITWDLMNPGLFGSAARTARITLEGLGFRCLVLDCNSEHRIRRSYIDEAIRSNIAGLLLCGVPGEVPNPDEDLLDSLYPAVSSGIPCVLLKPWTGTVNLPAGVASIGWDSIAAVQLALSVLVQHGHTRIQALLAGTGAGFGGRYRGIDQAWRNLNLEFDEEESIVWSPAGQQTEEIKRRLAQYSAIFTPPSHLTLLAQACFETNVRWPRDISITSLGNRDFIPQLGRNPFTFVNLPIGRVSRGAAQLLSSMIQNEQFQTGQEYVVYGASTMAIENLEKGSVGEPRVKIVNPFLS